MQSLTTDNDVTVTNCFIATNEQWTDKDTGKKNQSHLTKKIPSLEQLNNLRGWDYITPMIRRQNNVETKRDYRS